MLNDVKIKILDNKLTKLPDYLTKGSAGLDLRASINRTIEVKPNETKLISTGISIFIEDSMLTNIYQPWAHDDPDEAYTEDEGSIILENWGWFDIDDSYYFYYNEKQFIVKLADGERYIKLWPYQYYGNEGQSAHISLIYDFIIPPR